MTPEHRGADRWSWLVGAVWVIFLGFPLLDAYTADADDVVRWVTTGAVAAFGLLYIAIMRLVAVAERYPDLERRSLPYLLAMTGIFVGATWVLGVNALGLMPFLAASAAFTLRIRWAIITTVVAIGVSVILPVVLPDQLYGLFYVGLVVAVTVFSLAMRFAERHEAEQHAWQRELDIVGERERVARDVHDVVGHSLTAVTAKAELAERLIDLDPEGARRELQQIQSLTRESLAEIRATISGLRVARLSDELAAARVALRDSGIGAEVPEGAEGVDPRHRIVCAWVLREAVTNVVRHSGASVCTVTLRPDGITIVDDGRGYGHASDGHGVRGMRERVQGAGGTLTIGPADDGSGTRIEVWM